MFECSAAVVRILATIDLDRSGGLGRREEPKSTDEMDSRAAFINDGFVRTAEARK